MWMVEDAEAVLRSHSRDVALRFVVVVRSDILHTQGGVQ